jgi:hypothetical protein
MAIREPYGGLTTRGACPPNKVSTAGRSSSRPAPSAPRAELLTSATIFHAEMREREFTHMTLSAQFGYPSIPISSSRARAETRIPFETGPASCKLPDCDLPAKPTVGQQTLYCSQAHRIAARQLRHKERYQ